MWFLTKQETVSARKQVVLGCLKNYHLKANSISAQSPSAQSLPSSPCYCIHSALSTIHAGLGCHSDLHSQFAQSMTMSRRIGASDGAIQNSAATSSDVSDHSNGMFVSPFSHILISIFYYIAHHPFPPISSVVPYHSCAYFGNTNINLLYC